MGIEKMFEVFHKKREMVIEDQKCDHNPRSRTSTLEKLSKREMVYPPVEWYSCKCCGQTFRIRKNVDNQ